MNIKTLFSFILLFGITFMQGQTIQRPDYLPEGWVIPDVVKLAPGTGWEHFLNRGNALPFYATGDFNGDNMPDYAWALLKEDDSSWELFAFISSPSGSFKMVDVGGKRDSFTDPENLYTGPITQVEIVSLTKRVTLCQYDNNYQVSKRVQMRQDAIFWGVSEGDRISLYYNDSTGAFEKFFYCQ